MQWQFSSIFPPLFFIALFLLPLSRPPSHAPDLLFTLVLGLFFVNVKHWWKHAFTRRAFWGSLLVILFLGLAAWSGTYPLNWLAVISLAEVFLLVPVVVWIGGQMGYALLGVVISSMIVLWAQWGVAQFIVQHDLGLSMIGESRLSTDRAAVAKFSVPDGKILRAYGPFLHANTFGGIMLLGLVLLYRLRNLPGRFLLPAWAMTLLGLFLSFSRAALLGLPVLFFAWLTASGVQWAKVSLVSFAMLLTLSPLWYYRLTDRDDVGVVERGVFFQWWQAVTGGQAPWRGVGPGNYTVALQDYVQHTGESHRQWQVAPVHSVPLLLLAEWGWVWGAAASLVMAAGGGMLLPATMAFPLLFDHYFLTQLAPLAYFIVTATIVRLRGRLRQRPR